MNSCGHAIVVTGLVTAFAFPAYAANHSMDATMMTCVDFTAMDELNHAVGRKRCKLQFGHIANA